MNRGAQNLAIWLLPAIIAGGLMFGLQAASAQAVAPLPQVGQTQVAVTTIQLPVVPIDHALTPALNPTYNIPYTRLNWGQIDTTRTELRTFTLLVLENNYLKLTLLPQLGGRLYQAIFKPTGHNLLYQNPVVKPSPWGPPEMGYWWAVGGIEWGLPVEEHGYEWGTPWAYSISQLPDGVAVTLRDSAAADRLQTAVSITLPNNAAYFEISPALHNPTPHAVDFKFWLNAMLAPGAANKVGPNLRFILPADRVTVHSADDSRLPDDWQQAGWPIHNGVDYSRLSNWQGWYGFFQYPQAAGNFQAIYDEDANEGIVRTYPAEIVRGAKFFGFGYGARALPPNLYTNNDSSYVEMHGGLAPTFADTRRLEAGQSVAWSERWYPVAALRSLTWANRHAAIHLESSGDITRLHLALTQRRDNVRVVVAERATNRLLFQADGLLLDPAAPYHSPPLTLPGLTKDKLSVLVYADDVLLAAFQSNGEPPVAATPSPVPTSTPTRPPTATPSRTPTATATPSPAPTVTPSGSWAGRVRATIPVAGWSTILRIWVKDKFRTPVTISALSWNWQALSYTGTKLEYGFDALEFAPLPPGYYRVTVPEVAAKFDFYVPAGHITEVVFEPLAAPSPSPTATPTPTATATRTASPTATATAAAIPSATSTVSPATTNTPSPSPTATATTVPSATPTQLPTATNTPSPTPAATATAPPSPSPTATAASSPTPGWHVELVSNNLVSSNWFAVVRASVDGHLNWPVRITMLNNGVPGWGTICLTGTKPEYGRYTCEFSPLIPATYLVSAIGTDTSITVQVAGGHVAVVAFEEY